MLVVEGGFISDAKMSDRGVRDLPALLRAGDCLVFNDTRVIPAQLEGQRGVRRDGAGMTRVSLKTRQRSEEHTSELQSLMRSSYAVFCLKKKRKEDTI